MSLLDRNIQSLATVKRLVLIFNKQFIIHSTKGYFDDAYAKCAHAGISSTANMALK
jgi:hypothetical protein